MNVGAITSFTGEYFFLSNFYTAEFEWQKESYLSGEHAFQAAKGRYMRDQSKAAAYEASVRGAPTPSRAKYLGRSATIDVGQWDANKVAHMSEIVHAKFSQVPGLAGQLINTGAMMLVEGNDWGDSFWGRVQKDGRWHGHNVLGVLLMHERGFWMKGRP